MNVRLETIIFTQLSGFSFDFGNPGKAKPIEHFELERTFFGTGSTYGHVDGVGEEGVDFDWDCEVRILCYNAY